MHFRKLLIILLPIITLFYSCAPEHSKIVLAEFGNDKIYMDEFEKAYAKNSGGIEKAKNDSIDAMKEFLNLYVNYKMKLRDAFVRGYTQDPVMQKEIIDYKGAIGGTLFLESNLYEPNLKKLYEMRKTEYRASHIFLTPDSSKTEVQCEKLAEELIVRLNKGEDFAALAKQYSDDTYTKNTGGDVYYFTAGIIASPAIEDAVYSLEEGQVSQTPVHSSYGYHVIKITDKQPRKTAIEAKHILASVQGSDGELDTVKSYEKILDIKKKLDAGEDFSALAKQYSDDPGSGANGGDLGSFSRGRMVRPFDEAAFKLNVGEVSDIVKSQFGYHIIKVTKIEDYPSYQDQKEELKEMYNRTRYKSDYDNLIAKLKTEFNYNLNQATYNKIEQNLDTLKFGSPYWESDLQKEIGALEIFSINNKKTECDTLFKYFEVQPGFAGRKIDKDQLKTTLDKYVGELLIKQKGLIYDKEDPEFARLMAEYGNGIYLFKILEEEVWTKVDVDSSKTFNYYQQTKENYKWKDRVEFRELYVTSDSLAQAYYKMAVSGYDFDTLATKYTQRTGYANIAGYSGLVEVEVNDLSKKANSLKSIGDISEPFKYQDGWSIVKLLKRESARLKTFDEVKAEVASLFQEVESKRLEEEYVNRLKNVYNPTIYYNELREAFKP